MTCISDAKDGDSRSLKGRWGSAIGGVIRSCVAQSGSGKAPGGVL